MSVQLLEDRREYVCLFSFFDFLSPSLSLEKTYVYDTRHERMSKRQKEIEGWWEVVGRKLQFFFSYHARTAFVLKTRVLLTRSKALCVLFEVGMVDLSLSLSLSHSSFSLLFSVCTLYQCERVVPRAERERGKESKRKIESTTFPVVETTPREKRVAV